jgi:hypothetical protein
LDAFEKLDGTSLSQLQGTRKVSKATVSRSRHYLRKSSHVFINLIEKMFDYGRRAYNGPEQSIPRKARTFLFSLCLEQRLGGTVSRAITFSRI